MMANIAIVISVAVICCSILSTQCIPMLRLNPLQLTPTENITQLIEQKQCFALDEVCELTIYETRKFNNQLKYNLMQRSKKGYI